MTEPLCRICAIEQDAKKVLDDSEGDVGNALAVCYVAGFSEAALVPEIMAKSFCPRHAVKVLYYLGVLGKSVDVPRLLPPSDKWLN